MDYHKDSCIVLNFYMCPPCDETCDFWFYSFRASLLEYRCCLIIWVHWCLLPLWHSGVSNLSTFMICSVLSPLAVLFLEFWKRRQFQLQYEWDTLGFEAAEVCAHYYSRYTLILL